MLNDNLEYKVKTLSGGDAGKIVFKQFTLVERPTFVEILRSGLQLSLAVAIDFTASNGAY